MAASAEIRPPELKISQFEGPLDLLIHLIEKNKVDIYDIPIAEITDQYLTYLDGLDELDMDLASDFLLMASTLLHIKSRLLLPGRSQSETPDEADPREELVLKLLEYRRCKTLAAELKTRHERYREARLKLPEPPGRLGLNLLAEPGRLNWDLFLEACQHLARQNRSRYQDQREKMTHILKRDKVSLKETMRQIVLAIVKKTRVFFNELFPDRLTTRTERVTAFLAVLELLRLNRIFVRQDRPFDVMLIEPNLAVVETGDEFDRLPAQAIEEKAYD
ncbi:MAG: segregation/condensation protein A [Eubacteriales bacterium]|nr:segregation/condensation protein A [Clostridiales bacterium]MDD2440789.1 segregation/condensation protein A [Eubacteriales bacterium]